MLVLEVVVVVVVTHDGALMLDAALEARLEVSSVA